MSSIKGIRETHRARSLALSSQNRARYTNARQGKKQLQRGGNNGAGGSSGDSVGGALGHVDVRRGGAAGATAVALALEMREARADSANAEQLSSSSSGDEDDKAGQDDESDVAERGAPRGGSIEVPLVDLPTRHRPRRISSDFEIVPRGRGVIALDLDDDFHTGSGRRGASVIASRSKAVHFDGNDEDDWEILEADDECTAKAVVH